MPRPSLLVLLAAACLLGCSQHHVVSLWSAGDAPRSTARDRTPLEVITRATGVADPLPVEGSAIAYGQVETALGYAVLAAATPWSDSHHGAGYQLTIELTRAEARYREGRLSVSMGLRATLRSRVGNRYVAQTQARCDQAGVTTPDRGAPVFSSCTTFLGRSLASWLDGLPIAAVDETQKPTP